MALAYKDEIAADPDQNEFERDSVCNNGKPVPEITCTRGSGSSTGEADSASMCIFESVDDTYTDISSHEDTSHKTDAVPLQNIIASEQSSCPCGYYTDDGLYFTHLSYQDFGTWPSPVIDLGSQAARKRMPDWTTRHNRWFRRFVGFPDHALIRNGVLSLTADTHPEKSTQPDGRMIYPLHLSLLPTAQHSMKYGSYRFSVMPIIQCNNKHVARLRSDEDGGNKYECFLQDITMLPELSFAVTKIGSDRYLGYGARTNVPAFAEHHLRFDWLEDGMRVKVNGTGEVDREPPTKFPKEEYAPELVFTVHVDQSPADRWTPVISLHIAMLQVFYNATEFSADFYDFRRTCGNAGGASSATTCREQDLGHRTFSTTQFSDPGIQFQQIGTSYKYKFPSQALPKKESDNTRLTAPPHAPVSHWHEEATSQYMAEAAVGPDRHEL